MFDSLSFFSGARCLISRDIKTKQAFQKGQISKISFSPPMPRCYSMLLRSSQRNRAMLPRALHDGVSVENLQLYYYWYLRNGTS